MNIQKLTLYTSQLSQQKKFYHELLGFELLQENADSFAIKMGKSNLHFKAADKSTSYHFALNIPSYQEEEAMHWLEEKAIVLCAEDNTKLHRFEDWNAMAMYFYDPDNNIVEFIARKNLNETHTTAFDANSILEISEIGMPSDSIEKHYQYLNKQLHLDIYSGSMHRFCAIGDERGLIICIDKTIKNWFPVDDKAYSSPFEIDIENDGKKYALIYKNDEIQMKSDPTKD